jgi:hypothetical protein
MSRAPILPKHDGILPFREVMMAKVLVGFSANDRVSHTVFGLGTILGVDSKYTTIAFDERGTKKFITSLVQLGPSSTPAPRKAARPKKVAAAGNRP